MECELKRTARSFALEGVQLPRSHQPGMLDLMPADAHWRGGERQREKIKERFP